MKKTFFASITIIFSITIACQAELQVNTYTNEHQYHPAVAMNKYGDSIVVWRSDAQEGIRSVYGQRYNAEGNPVGGEFKVNTTACFNLSTWWPSVAMHSSGSFVVVWPTSDTTEQGDVVARLYDMNGIPLTGELLVSNDLVPISHQGEATVAMNDNGDFVIVWNSWHGDNNGKYYVTGRLYNATGVPQGNEFVISQLPHGKNPIVAMHDSGDFVVAWLRQGDSDDLPIGNYIRFRMYYGDGIPNGDAVQITNEIGSYDEAVTPSLAMAKNGNFVIAWGADIGSSLYDIYAQQFDVNGVSVFDPYMVNTYTDSYQLSASIGMNEQGQFTIAWSSMNQDGSDLGVFGQLYSKEGTPVENEFQLNTYTSGRQWYPNVAINNSGKYVAIWQSEGGQDGSGHGIFGEFGQFPQPHWTDLANHSYELVWQERLSRTEFEYCFQMRATNLGTEPIENVTVELTSAPVNITILNSKVFFGLIPIGGEVLSDDTFIVKIDRSSSTDENDIIWEISNEMEGDFSDDDKVNFVDFAYLASKWLQTGPSMPEDLYKNEIIDFDDLAMFLENWLKD